MTDRRDSSTEEIFRRLLEEHIKKEDAYKQQMFESLTELKDTMTILTNSTKDMLEAYNTAQQAIKISIFLGKAVKWIGSMILLYYSLSEFLNSVHKT